MAVATVATLAIQVGSLYALHALGLWWTGETFGGGPENWADYLCQLAVAGVFAALAIPPCCLVSARIDRGRK